MNVLNQSIVKHKMSQLNLADELRNDSQACRVMSVSRDTFCRIKEAKESGGLEALLHKDRLRSNLKIRVDDAVEQAILAFAISNPAAGQIRVSNELEARDVCQPEAYARCRGEICRRGPGAHRTTDPQRRIARRFTPRIRWNG